MGALRPSGKATPVSVRIPLSLLEEINELKARAGKLRMTISLPALVIDGLMSEMAIVRMQIEGLEGGAPAKPAPVKPAAVTSAKKAEPPASDKDNGKGVADNALEGWVQ